MQWSRLVFSTLFLKTVLISVLVSNALLDMDAGSKVLPFWLVIIMVSIVI